MYICALHFLKMTNHTYIEKHSEIYSKFIFRRGFPNKMIPTKNYEPILNDVVVIHFKHTRHSRKKCGCIAIVQVAVEKVTMTTFLFQCYVFCISFIVFMSADLSVIWQVLDCYIGLTCAA